MSETHVLSSSSTTLSGGSVLFDEPLSIFDIIADVQQQMSLHVVNKAEYDSDKAKWRSERDTFYIEKDKWDKEKEELSSKQNVRLVAIRKMEEEIEEQEEVMKKEKEILQLAKESYYRKEQEKENALSNPLSSDSKIIKLNVGGRVFCTSLATLTESPRTRGSFLAALFSSHNISKLPIYDGHYFIDRDPQPFAHILTFLRTGFVPSEADLPRNKPEWTVLILEIEYWGLSTLQDAIITKDAVELLKLEEAIPVLSVTDVIENILTNDDVTKMLTQLSGVHEVCCKYAKIFAKSKSFVAPVTAVEEVILNVLDSLMDRKIPLGTVQAFKEVLKEFDYKKAHATVKGALRLLRTTMKHDSTWSELFKDFKTSIELSTGTNGVVTEGRKFNKTSTTVWNCGVIGNDPIPTEGTFEWTVKLGTNCNNLMIGVAVGNVFNKIGPNYSNSKGWYFYCFNGTLYSRNGNGVAWAGGPGASYTANTTIKIMLDLDKKTMGFVINGVDRGIAFRDVEPMNGATLYPAFDVYENNCNFEIED